MRRRHMKEVFSYHGCTRMKELPQYRIMERTKTAEERV